MEMVGQNGDSPPESRKKAKLPHDGLPLGAPPRWASLPLDSKLPMVPGAKEAVVFCTTKLGEKIRMQSPQLDFDLTDPLCHLMSNDYHPLHDPHLKALLNSSDMRRRLYKGGFITKDGRVLCTLKEFNEFRRYLRRLYLAIERQQKQILAAKKSKKKRDMNLQALTEEHGGRIRQVKELLQGQYETDRARLQKILDEDYESVAKKMKDEKSLRHFKHGLEKQMGMSTIAAEPTRSNQSLKIKQYSPILSRIFNRELDYFFSRMVDAPAHYHQAKTRRQLEEWEQKKKYQEKYLTEMAKKKDEEDQLKFERISHREYIAKKVSQKQQRELARAISKQKQMKEAYEMQCMKKLQQRIARAVAMRQCWPIGKTKSNQGRSQLISNWDLSGSLKSITTETESVKSEKKLNAERNDAVDVMGESRKSQQKLDQTESISPDSKLSLYSGEIEFGELSVDETRLSGYSDLERPEIDPDTLFANRNEAVSSAQAQEEYRLMVINSGGDITHNERLDIHQQPQTDREKKALMDELKEEKSMLSIPEIHDVQQCKGDDENATAEVIAEFISSMNVFLAAEVLCPAITKSLAAICNDKSLQKESASAEALPSETEILDDPEHLKSVRFNQVIQTLQISPDSMNDSAASPEVEEKESEQEDEIDAAEEEQIDDVINRRLSLVVKDSVHQLKQRRASGNMELLLFDRTDSLTRMLYEAISHVELMTEQERSKLKGSIQKVLQSPSARSSPLSMSIGSSVDISEGKGSPDALKEQASGIAQDVEEGSRIEQLSMQIPQPQTERSASLVKQDVITDDVKITFEVGGEEFQSKQTPEPENKVSASTIAQCVVQGVIDSSLQAVAAESKKSSEPEKALSKLVLATGLDEAKPTADETQEQLAAGGLEVKESPTLIASYFVWQLIDRGLQYIGGNVQEGISQQCLSSIQSIEHQISGSTSGYDAADERENADLDSQAAVVEKQILVKPQESASILAEYVVQDAIKGGVQVMASESREGMLGLPKILVERAIAVAVQGLVGLADEVVNEEESQNDASEKLTFEKKVQEEMCDDVSLSSEQQSSHSLLTSSSSLASAVVETALKNAKNSIYANRTDDIVSSCSNERNPPIMSINSGGVASKRFSVDHMSACSSEGKVDYSAGNEVASRESIASGGVESRKISKDQMLACSSEGRVNYSTGNDVVSREIIASASGGVEFRKISKDQMSACSSEGKVDYSAGNEVASRESIASGGVEFRKVSKDQMSACSSEGKLDYSAGNEVGSRESIASGGVEFRKVSKDQMSACSSEGKVDYSAGNEVGSRESIASGGVEFRKVSKDQMSACSSEGKVDYSAGNEVGSRESIASGGVEFRKISKDQMSACSSEGKVDYSAGNEVASRESIASGGVEFRKVSKDQMSACSSEGKVDYSAGNEVASRESIASGGVEFRKNSKNQMSACSSDGVDYSVGNEVASGISIESGGIASHDISDLLSSYAVPAIIGPDSEPDCNSLLLQGGRTPTSLCGSVPDQDRKNNAEYDDTLDGKFFPPDGNFVIEEALSETSMLSDTAVVDLSGLSAALVDEVLKEEEASIKVKDCSDQQALGEIGDALSTTSEPWQRQSSTSIKAGEDLNLLKSSSSAEKNLRDKPPGKRDSECSQNAVNIVYDALQKSLDSVQHQCTPSSTVGTTSCSPSVHEFVIGVLKKISKTSSSHELRSSNVEGEVSPVLKDVVDEMKKECQGVPQVIQEILTSTKQQNVKAVTAKDVEPQVPPFSTTSTYVQEVLRRISGETPDPCDTDPSKMASSAFFEELIKRSLSKGIHEVQGGQMQPAELFQLTKAILVSQEKLQCISDRLSPRSSPTPVRITRSLDCTPESMQVPSGILSQTNVKSATSCDSKQQSGSPATAAAAVPSLKSSSQLLDDFIRVTLERTLEQLQASAMLEKDMSTRSTLLGDAMDRRSSLSVESGRVKNDFIMKVASEIKNTSDVKGSNKNKNCIESDIPSPKSSKHQTRPRQNQKKSTNARSDAVMQNKQGKATNIEKVMTVSKDSLTGSNRLSITGLNDEDSLSSVASKPLVSSKDLKPIRGSPIKRSPCNKPSPYASRPNRSKNNANNEGKPKKDNQGGSGARPKGSPGKNPNKDARGKKGLRKSLSDQKRGKSQADPPRTKKSESITSTMFKESGLSTPSSNTKKDKVERDKSIDRKGEQSAHSSNDGSTATTNLKPNKKSAKTSVLDRDRLFEDRLLLTSRRPRMSSSPDISEALDDLSSEVKYGYNQPNIKDIQKKYCPSQLMKSVSLIEDHDNLPLDSDLQGIYCCNEKDDHLTSKPSLPYVASGKLLRSVAQEALNLNAEKTSSMSLVMNKIEDKGRGIKETLNENESLSVLKSYHSGVTDEDAQEVEEEIPCRTVRARTRYSNTKIKSNSKTFGPPGNQLSHINTYYMEGGSSRTPSRRFSDMTPRPSDAFSATSQQVNKMRSSHQSFRSADLSTKLIENLGKKKTYK